MEGLWCFHISNFSSFKVSCLRQLFLRTSRASEIPSKTSIWNKRAWYCWDAKQMIALCTSSVQRLLPNVDGIVGFGPSRHLHRVVYRPKESLWGRAVGKETIHILQLILLVKTMGNFRDDDDSKQLRESAAHQGFTGHEGFCSVLS